MRMIGVLGGGRCADSSGDIARGTRRSRIRGMRAVCAVLLAGAATGAATGTVRAQDVRAFPVKVVGADGRPAAGAEVVVLAIARMVPELGALDVVRGRTDADGRARVELRSGLDHRAWATTADAASPTAAVVAGRQIELRLAPAKQTLHVDGLDAWSAYGPLRLRVWIHGVGGLCADQLFDQG